MVLAEAQEGGRKDDLAVALLDLQRTASTLKQPVPFIDKPASLFVPWATSLGAKGDGREMCTAQLTYKAVTKQREREREREHE